MSNNNYTRGGTRRGRTHRGGTRRGGTRRGGTRRGGTRRGGTRRGGTRRGGTRRGGANCYVKRRTKGGTKRKTKGGDSNHINYNIHADPMSENLIEKKSKLFIKIYDSASSDQLDKIDEIFEKFLEHSKSKKIDLEDFLKYLLTDNEVQHLISEINPTEKQVDLVTKLNKNISQNGGMSATPLIKTVPMDRVPAEGLDDDDDEEGDAAQAPTVPEVFRTGVLDIAQQDAAATTWQRRRQRRGRRRIANASLSTIVLLAVYVIIASVTAPMRVEARVNRARGVLSQPTPNDLVLWPGVDLADEPVTERSDYLDLFFRPYDHFVE